MNGRFKCCQEYDFRHFQQEGQLKMWNDKEQDLSTPFLAKSGQKREPAAAFQSRRGMGDDRRWLSEISVNPDRIKLGKHQLDWHTVDHLVALRFVSNAGTTSL